MLEKFKPDMYVTDFYKIDFKKLKNMDIKCLLLDLDNTLASNKVKKASKKLKDMIERLKDMGFKVIIFSNASKSRVKPFKEKLDIDSAYSCKKPFTIKYKKIKSLYKYKESEVAIVGDQLLMDILMGNKVGIYTILVEPIDSYELIFTKINRVIEKIIFKKLEKRNMFKKGEGIDLNT